MWPVCVSVALTLYFLPCRERIRAVRHSISAHSQVWLSPLLRERNKNSSSLSLSLAAPMKFLFLTNWKARVFLQRSAGMKMILIILRHSAIKCSCPAYINTSVKSWAGRKLEEKLCYAIRDFAFTNVPTVIMHPIHDTLLLWLWT